DLCA
ncbi:hypothetical protein D046_4993, partial [Vibrio parahaemolyticus V-223/04]